MTAADSILALTRDARLTPFATSGIGAWLWASDATRIIWANTSGAAVLGADTPAALTEKRFDPDEPFAQDIARLAASLPATGATRLERVRGTGSNLVSTCSRVALPGDTFGILVIAAEPARPALALAERVARLFAPASEAAAVFSLDGKLIYATGTLEPDTTLVTLGAEELKDGAIQNGKASGDTALGPLTLERLGGGSAMVLVARLPDDGHEGAVASSKDTPERVASVDVAHDAAASSPASNDIAIAALPPAAAESDAAAPAPPDDHDLTELAGSIAAASPASTDGPQAPAHADSAPPPDRPG